MTRRSDNVDMSSSALSNLDAMTWKHIVTALVYALLDVAQAIRGNE